MPTPSRLPHSVRLFPKGKGATAYELTGIAGLCDWALLSDLQEPVVALRDLAGTDRPRTVFLSLRNPRPALVYFHRRVLPRLKMPFVLVSGSEDVTLPRQTDCRWPAFDAEMRDILRSIADAPMLTHWFAENLDQQFADTVSPLPTGLVFPSGGASDPMRVPDVPKMSQRPLRIFCAHRVRDGSQWDPRKNVSAIAQGDWASFTTYRDTECTEPEFLASVSRHSFVACVEGGGLDPSPKAWQSILYGAIPIIRRSAASRAYDDLPCVQIDAWESDRISVSHLERWKARFAEFFDSDPLRRQVLDTLTLSRQWDKIRSRLSTGRPSMP